MPLKITIDLLNLLYTSLDGGRTWQHQEQKLPEEWYPVFTGDANPNHIPFRSDNTCWRFLHYNQHQGMGVAADSAASIYFTMDSNAYWQKLENYQVGLVDRLKMAIRMCWPAKTYDSMVVSPDLRICLCWQDPWIMRGSKTHLLLSNTTGTSWRYRCMGNAFPWLTLDPAYQLIMFSDHCMHLSPDWGRTWKKVYFSIEWGDRYQKNLRWTRFQRIDFATMTEAYAITPTWMEGPNHTATQDQMAVLKTIDGGIYWHLMDLLPMPDSTKTAGLNIDSLLNIHVE